MKARVEHREDEDRERPADPAPPAHHPAAMALRLQSTAGNQATARMVQRFGIPSVVGGLTGGALSVGFDYAWRKFVESNREGATYHTIDPTWRQLAIEYSHYNKADGQWIGLGIKRLPDFWIGGWLLAEAGSATHAITLNRDIFFNPETSGEPNVDTYVHELVHVAQYALLGVKGFLGSYAVEFVKGWIAGDSDTDPYHQIAHEKQAAAIEERFKAWRETKEKEPQPPAPPDPIKDAEDAMKPAPISDVGAFPLGGSVGAKGDNKPEDVKRVAARLHALGYLDEVTTDIEKVTDAIERYQSEVLRWPRPDGRVDVNNKTHKALKLGRKGTSMAL